MKTQDDQRWAEQVSDLRSDGEAGQRFLDFYEFWFSTAETLMAENGSGIDRIFTEKSTVHHYVERALDLAEHEFGYLSTDLIGSMLTVASMHWHYGPQMMEGLTLIEHRVTEEALARKIAALQNTAADEQSAL